MAFSFIGSLKLLKTVSDILFLLSFKELILICSSEDNMEISNKKELEEGYLPRIYSYEGLLNRKEEREFHLTKYTGSNEGDTNVTHQIELKNPEQSEMSSQKGMELFRVNSTNHQVESGGTIQTQRNLSNKSSQSLSKTSRLNTSYLKGNLKENRICNPLDSQRDSRPQIRSILKKNTKFSLPEEQKEKEFSFSYKRPPKQNEHLKLDQYQLPELITQPVSIETNSPENPNEKLPSFFGLENIGDAQRQAKSIRQTPLFSSKTKFKTKSPPSDLLPRVRGAKRFGLKAPKGSQEKSSFPYQRLSELTEEEKAKSSGVKVGFKATIAEINEVPNKRARIEQEEDFDVCRCVEYTAICKPF